MKEERGGKKEEEEDRHTHTHVLGFLSLLEGIAVCASLVVMTISMKAQSVVGATVAAVALMLVSVIALAPAPVLAGPLLEEAISWGNVEKVREILANKQEEVDSEDDYGHTALQYAIRIGNLDIAKLLVEHGANTKV